MRPADKLRVRRGVGQIRDGHQLDGWPVGERNKVRFKTRAVFAEVAFVTLPAKNRLPELNLGVQMTGPECDMCNIHINPRFALVGWR
ncbi:hypothetical protein D3C75_586730 [compost metagenome]